MSVSCEVCGSLGAFSSFQAAEKMFGMGGSFTYARCAECDTLFLVDVPVDLGQYYPSYYYSFSSATVKQGWMSKLKVFLWDERLRALNRSAIGARQLLHFFPNAGMDALIKLQPKREWDILDVGCGAGDLVRALRKQGFSKAIGADAFVQADVYHDGSLLVKKAQPQDLTGRFDLIMLHHAFEHMPKPHDQLQMLHALLKPGGKLLLRFPTVSSEAFERYGVNWVQLDAPRHLFLHSEKGMRLLAKQNGFEVNDFYTDAIDFQFWGSEWYAQGGSLFDSSGKAIPAKKQFGAHALRKMKAETQLLNQHHRGDQAVWVLQKK
jgi:SAM-dependent methyltransferase